MRLRAAAMARTYDGSRTAWQRFMDEFGECDDPGIAELVDLIEHEPQRGGFLGVSESEWAAYRASVGRAIQNLERGSAS